MSETQQKEEVKEQKPQEEQQQSGQQKNNEQENQSAEQKNENSSDPKENQQNEQQNQEGQSTEQMEQQPKKEKGPYDVDESDMTPRFVRAMQVLGFTSDDLRKKNRKDIIQIIKTKDPLGNKINQELLDALSNHLESSRQQKIDQIRKEIQYIQVPDQKQKSQQLPVADQSIMQSQTGEKSMVLDKSIISMSKSILTKSLSPLELEFKLYDKIKKKERAEVHKAKKEEELLSRQIEYQHKQKELEDRLEKHRIIKQKQIHHQSLQKQEIQKWLHNRSDAESSNFYQAKSIVDNLQVEMKETYKQRQFLNPREKIDKVKSMNDLRVKEIEDLQAKREQNMIQRLEKLQELSTKVDNENNMKMFQDLQRELKGLLKQEKVQIRQEMLDEYHEFMKKQHVTEEQKKIKQVIKNKTRQEIEQTMYKQLLEIKQQDLDKKLEKFKQLQTNSLKVKSSSAVQFGKNTSSNNFGQMKVEYERRIGFQEDLIREIDRTENIQRRQRREEQEKQDLLMKKEALKQQNRELEVSKISSIVSDMKQFENSNMASTKRQLAQIRNQHVEREQKILKEIEDRKQKEAQEQQKKEKLEFEKKKERLRKDIDQQKKTLQEEEKKKQQEQQQEQ